MGGEEALLRYSYELLRAMTPPPSFLPFPLQNASFCAEEWDASGEPLTPAPRQNNRCDCGVFLLANADYFLLGMRPTFTQAFMAHFRKHIARACLATKLALP